MEVAHINPRIKSNQNAMPTIKKAPKARIFAIIAALLTGLALSFKYSWMLPMIASFGGIVVFIGLWIEQGADEIGEGTHADPFIFDDVAYAIKHKKSLGWWILMAGIFCEIIITAVAAYVEWENAPENQQVQTAKAVITLFTAGTNDPRENVLIKTADPLLTFSTMSSKLAFGSPELMSNGAPSLFAPVISKTGFWPSNASLFWEIDFEGQDHVFMHLPPTPLKTAKEWRKFEIDVPFMRANTEIITGAIDLSINNSPIEHFPIADQKVRDASSNNLHAFWDNLTNGTAIFNQTNTHSLLQ